jgi:hypothetical protein
VHDEHCAETSGPTNVPHVSACDGGGVLSTHDPVATSHVVPLGHVPQALAFGSQLPDDGAHTNAVLPSLVTSCVQLSPLAQSESLTQRSAHASSPPI